MMPFVPLFNCGNYSLNSFNIPLNEEIQNLQKNQGILNVRKKKRKGLYDALADVEVLAQAKALYEKGLSGMEVEFTRYMDAEAVLERSGAPRERLTAEKAAIYEQLAQVNADIRAARKKLALCKEIQDRLPRMERTIEKIESREAQGAAKPPPVGFLEWSASLEIRKAPQANTPPRVGQHDKKRRQCLLKS